MSASDSAANPWPGLASYTEEQRHLFFGRAAETSEVVRLVGRETLTVLFGRSGLGKSSLLRAGVMPRLREQGFFPVTLRLDFGGHAAADPVEQVKALTSAAARQAGIEVEGLPEGAADLTLWEWFHAAEFWGQRNDPVTPILALDQFEEVFTLGRGLPSTDRFLEQLADLIENRVPQSVRRRVEADAVRLPYDALRQDYKVILSLREDFVPKLDGLRPLLPAIMRNRFALAPLDAGCACAVVLGAGRTWIADDDAREIVAAVVGGDGPLVYHPDAEVEPAYLSVMCHELFRRMQALGRGTITHDLVAAERGGILEGLYARSFEGIGDPVRFFVEDRLLTPSGFRGTLPLADATHEGVASEDLHKLVNRRLLRFEDRLGTIHLELSHDLLTGIVLKRRESRRAEAALKLETERTQKLRAAQLAQRRHSRVVAAVAVLLACLLLGTLWGGYYCFLQEHRASYRTVVTRRGFPVGIGELSAAQTRRLPLHYVLVYKGITWDGWRPRWKPPLRLMAVDQRGALTTNHGVGTFFWRAHDEAQPGELNKDRGMALGLSAVCQWEYVPDTGGDIAYERGLDREGRMVYSCVYSPLATGSRSARIAHYVGPDGFPQLQHKSAAEYVEIHYDADGWDERIRYLDAMALPAVGPDGAFGLTEEHDGSGRQTGALSLDERGRPMLNRDGVAGVRLAYNNDGLVSELTAFDTEGRVAAVTDGWARVRATYDSFGRRTLLQSFDADGRPVMRRTSFSGVADEYDDDGDLVLERFLDPDGQSAPLVGQAAAIRHDFDRAGNETRTVFLDHEGRLARGWDGTCGYASGYDERRNLASRTLLGADGQPFLIADGYAGWKSEFDDQGRETRRTHYGRAGEPVMAKDGYHGWEKRYDARGNAVHYTYLGLDGKPAFANDQTAGWDAEFDPRGREVRRTVIGPAGERVLHVDGYHASVTGYDEHGYESGTTYLDLAGKPVTLSKGYAATKLEHDSQGHETKRTFFDAAGKPVVASSGEHGTVSKYDERGNLVETTTINLVDRPVSLAANGYATERTEYDPHGNILVRRYFDTDGGAVTNTDGVAVMRNRRNVQGWLLEERYEDPEGKPAANKAGVHYWTIGNDAFGKRTRLATFGLHDDPVPGIDKACVKVVGYDERNNETEAKWFGPDGKPALCDEGYARRTLRYDEALNISERACYGTDDQPCLALDKTHRWTKRYDALRDVLRWDFFGVHGEPVVGIGGYAGTEMEYDARGKETRKTTLGTDGEPLALAAGYATRRRSYLPGGQISEERYLAADGSPALSESGFSVAHDEYDDDGKLQTWSWTGLPGLTAYATDTDRYVDGLRKSERFLAADGRLVNSALGYAQLTIDHDDSGNVVRYVYRDAGGQPAYGEAGYAGAETVSRGWKYYDASGSVMTDIEHGGVRPLMYVVFLRSREGAAAKAGLQPGDILWRVGDFSYPRVLESFWEKDNDYATFKSHVYEVWAAKVTARPQNPVIMTVIRAGEAVELSLTVSPSGVFGMNTDLRRVPVQEYEAMVNRFGLPAATK